MESQVKRHIRGLDVLMVPELGVPSRGDAEEAHGEPDLGYEDARCQGCVFNNPFYEVDMAPHTCSVQVELGRECGAAHGDKQRSIYILPEMMEAYKTRFAYQRMVRRSNP